LNALPSYHTRQKNQEALCTMTKIRNPKQAKMTETKNSKHERRVLNLFF
jgi:hypothetical protein